ncbi:spore germination protein [Paenibacillus aceris]|uniref:Spore germination protein n=1 Tax=Paenibacillus aceris TaxID=869555 RepID=A0ABS4I4D8_9BACL|nr:hypothetical protein [Paenibacillus aceris]
MQSIIGALMVVTNSGTITNGNSFNIAPTQSSTTFKGSGTDVTGDHVMTFSFFNATITYGSNSIDDSPVKVNRKLSKNRRKPPGTN